MQKKIILTLLTLVIFLMPVMSHATAQSACWASNCTSYNNMRQCRSAYNYPTWMALLQDNPNCGQAYAEKCKSRNLRGESYSGCKHGDDALALCAMANLITPEELLHQNPNCAQNYHGKWKFEQNSADVFRRSQNTVVSAPVNSGANPQNFAQDPF
jgi:hypothetical protein